MTVIQISALRKINTVILKFHNFDCFLSVSTVCALCYLCQLCTCVVLLVCVDCLFPLHDVLKPTEKMHR